MANTSLIDRLREIADFVPVSHIPALSELSKVVGALALYVEHGDNLFQIAEKGGQAVHELISPAEKDAPPASAASGFAPDVPTPAPQAAPQPDERDAEIARLRQELANAEATQHQTTGSVEPVPPEAHA